MKSQKMFKLFIVLFIAGISFTACSKDDDNPAPINNDPMTKSIVETAASDAQFSILVAALEKADLVTALQGDGPFTVFAPTNDAFTKLFMDLGVDGIDDLSKEALTPILLYHVLGAKVMASEVTTDYVKTLNMDTPDGMPAVLYTNIMNGVMLNSTTTVTLADIEASNGVIHVIDNVLLPQNVVDIAINNTDFSILVEAVVKAELVDALSAEGPFTIFAPTNAAFETLFMDLGVNGISDLTAEQLTPILLYHVVGDNVRSEEVGSGMVPTLNTMSDLTVDVSSMGVKLDGNSNVTKVDIQGTNGVIHVIDKVLLP